LGRIENKKQKGLQLKTKHAHHSGHVDFGHATLSFSDPETNSDK